jgi:uncharacterized membrane protein
MYACGSTKLICDKGIVTYGWPHPAQLRRGRDEDNQVGPFGFTICLTRTGCGDDVCAWTTLARCPQSLLQRPPRLDSTMSKDHIGTNRKSGLAETELAGVRTELQPAQDLVTMAATVGMIAVGVALFEVALIPGMAIGAAAVLAPNLASKRLPKLGRRLRALFNSTVRPRVNPADSLPDRPAANAPLAAAAKFGIKQALAKTITFRITVTTLDLTWNYIVIGELATAAGLSAFSLAVGPVFYFAHETAWNYFGSSVERTDDLSETAGAPPVRLPPSTKVTLFGREELTINRALAKTIVYQTVGTTMDFTTNYVVVADLVTAAILTAPRFLVGPFVYLGHEMAWDYFGAPRKARQSTHAQKARSEAGSKISLGPLIVT